MATKPYPNDRIMHTGWNVPVNFISDSDVDITVPHSSISTREFFIWGAADFQEVSTLLTVPIAILDNGTTGQNISASKTFTGAATDRYFTFVAATGIQYPIIGATDRIRLHITTKAGGQSNTAAVRASNVVTITLANPHGMVTGQTVSVVGVDASVNGDQIITSTPTTSSFTFDNFGANANLGSSGSAGICRANIQLVSLYF